MTEFLDTPVAPPRQAPQRINKKTLEAWRDEEPQLISAWQTKGCERSLTTLVQRYKPMILSQMQKILAGRSINTSHRKDLEQEAVLAFITAVNRFDEKFGQPLSSFAISSVRKSLLRYALDYRHAYRIGTSSDERKAFYAALARRAARIHSGESDILSDADIEQIAKDTGASKQATDRAVRSIYANSTTLDDAHNVTDRAAEGHDENMSVTSAMAVLQGFIAGLDERQSAILTCYLKDQDIDAAGLGAQFDLTPERIGQIRRDMLADMRIYLKKHNIGSDDLF